MAKIITTNDESLNVILELYDKRQYKIKTLVEIAPKCAKLKNWNEYYYFAWLSAMGMLDTLDILYD